MEGRGRTCQRATFVPQPFLPRARQVRWNGEWQAWYNEIHVMKPRTREVAEVTKRRRIPASAIHHVVAQIAERFSPRRIILFGSYARGKPRPESDVDLLVIMNTPREGEQSLRIRRAIQCDFGLDLIVCRPETLEQRLKLGDFFLREIVEQGKVLYESPDR
jgi:predicted nucleotidyltransferase